MSMIWNEFGFVCVWIHDILYRDLFSEFFRIEYDFEFTVILPILIILKFEFIFLNK